MKIGITVAGSNLESVVSDLFSECDCLLIVNIDDSSIGGKLKILEVTKFKNSSEQLSREMIEELIKYDCVAVITGDLEPDEFNYIADSCMTRFYGAGYPASLALDLMEKNELKLIRNLEGTDGCDIAHHSH